MFVLFAEKKVGGGGGGGEGRADTMWQSDVIMRYTAACYCSSGQEEPGLASDVFMV